jgi:hypothetical protein
MVRCQNVSLRSFERTLLWQLKYDPFKGAREATWTPGESPERALTNAFLRYCGSIPKKNRNFVSCVREWAKLRRQVGQSVDPEQANGTKIPKEFRQTLQRAFDGRF